MEEKGRGLIVILVSVFVQEISIIGLCLQERTVVLQLHAQQAPTTRSAKTLAPPLEPSSLVALAIASPFTQEPTVSHPQRLVKPVQMAYLVKTQQQQSASTEIANVTAQFTTSGLTVRHITAQLPRMGFYARMEGLRLEIRLIRALVNVFLAIPG